MKVISKNTTIKEDYRVEMNGEFFSVEILLDIDQKTWLDWVITPESGRILSNREENGIMNELERIPSY